MTSTPGCLYIVATPIGNLADLTPRATDVLADADVIAAEDTRHSTKLLARASAHVPLVALHEHNEDRAAPALIERMQGGEVVALIADAGTPLVSDPGFVLVRAAHEAGIPVRAVPGACAAIAALSVSGLPCDRFVFEGFLPAKPTSRRRRLGELADETRTLIFYESSHRIVRAARDLVIAFGAERQVCLSRELTKLHEDSVVLPAGELIGWLDDDANRRRGEFVLVIAGAERASVPAGRQVSLEALMRELVGSMSVADAARLATRLLDVSRNEAYRVGLEAADGRG